MSEDLVLSAAEEAALKYRMLVEAFKRQICNCKVCHLISVYEGDVYGAHPRRSVQS